jgi:ADP-heptose:LPS heptosyltransferase
MRPPDLTNFYQQTRTAKKIVVVDLGFLGDTLHLVPALCEINRHYPGAAIHVLSTPVGAEVLQLAPCVSRAWPVVLDPVKRKMSDQWRLIRGMRREKFDIAFNFTGVDRATILTGLSGARWRVAHRGGRSHFWNRWLIANWVPRVDPDLTIFEQRRQMLKLCGFQLEPPRFDLKVDEASRKWAANAVPDGAMHLSINSNNPLKEWPLDHYARMLRAVWQDQPGLRVMASGNYREREQERLKRLNAAVNDRRLQLLPGNMSIAQLAGVLRRCRLHLGSDSGVTHLAVALGLPTISFFRDQKGHKSWLPVGPDHRTFVVHCTCIDHHAAPCQASEKPECLIRLEPAPVAESVCEKLRTFAPAVSPA